MSSPFNNSFPLTSSANGSHYPTRRKYSSSSSSSSSPSSSIMECDETISHASGVPSGYSGTSADYMGNSTEDYESTRSASGIDLQEYMHERFSNSFNPIPLDRSMVVQAQTSGILNAKHRELLELQQQAQARLARTRERFAQGIRDAQEVRSDLEWTQKKVLQLQSKAMRKHPKEYTKARARFPSPDI